MATEKVGVYRKYYGTVPTDKLGSPLPKSEWPRLRPFNWAVRWFGSDGKRLSKSFKSRKEAERYAESKQLEVRVGKGDQPRVVTLVEFANMYLELRGEARKSPSPRLVGGGRQLGDRFHYFDTGSFQVNLGEKTAYVFSHPCDRVYVGEVKPVQGDGFQQAFFGREPWKPLPELFQSAISNLPLFQTTMELISGLNLTS